MSDVVTREELLQALREADHMRGFPEYANESPLRLLAFALTRQPAPTETDRLPLLTYSYTMRDAEWR